MTRQNSTTKPLVMKLQAWPQIDQDLWRTGTTWDERSHRKPYAATLRPITIRNAMRAYGRLLAVMAEHDLLDTTRSPAERLTREVANVFLEDMFDAGNNNNTIKVRFFDLRAAMRIMHPNVDTEWLTRPGDLSLHVLLPTEPTPRRLWGMRTLYEWGRRMMDRSSLQNDPISRARMYRNGLIISLFASRAPRILSLSLMKLGKQLQLDGVDCWVVFKPADLKSPKTVEYRLPPGLAARVDHYLASERPILLAGADHPDLWIGEHGEPLTLAGIQAMIWRASEAEFGQSFGPHQFRHELASAQAEADCETPGIAAAVLGTSMAVVEAEYTHARNDLAAAKLAAHLAEERDRTRLLAQRLFESRNPHRATFAQSPSSYAGR